MTITDSQRYREAILMAAVENDGLEELILRLVNGEYPDAYGTGPGQDAGVDVVSDLGDPPKRAWQAKNYFNTGIDWGKCSKSLVSAMKGPQPPHYTFVFPRKLKKNELKHWREEFHPTELAKFEELEALDFEDDLAWQLQDHPELIDEMSGGALSEYMQPIVEAIAKTGVSPLAKPAEQADAATDLAQQAVKEGKEDARFAYGVSGREAGAGDAELPERVARFMMSHSSGDLPSYSLALRDGETVVELAAQPRDGVEVEAPEPWFAPSDAGEEARMLARNSLAKGKPIELSGDDVGVRPAEVPERFRERLDEDGLLRAGTLNLGLSELVPLRVTLTVEDQVLRQVFALYRVPPLQEGSLAYGGALGGCAIFLDMRPVKGAETKPGEEAFELDLSLTLAVAGEKGGEALRGLGFARAFTSAERLHFDSPELLPEGGIEIGEGDGEKTNEETWEAAAVVAAALAALEARDGKEREMPEAVTLRDRLAAQMVFQVLTEGGIIVKTKGEFELPVPASAVEGKEPNQLRELHVELPSVADEESGVFAKQELAEIEPLEVVHDEQGRTRLHCRSAPGGGRIVVTLEE